jgi:hypothetical protein
VLFRSIRRRVGSDAASRRAARVRMRIRSL